MIIVQYHHIRIPWMTFSFAFAFASEHLNILLRNSYNAVSARKFILQVFPSQWFSGKANDDVGMALIPSPLIRAAYWFRIVVVAVAVIVLMKL